METAKLFSLIIAIAKCKKNHFQLCEISLSFLHLIGTEPGIAVYVCVCVCVCVFPCGCVFVSVRVYVYACDDVWLFICIVMLCMYERVWEFVPVHDCAQVSAIMRSTQMLSSVVSDTSWGWVTPDFPKCSVFHSRLMVKGPQVAKTNLFKVVQGSPLKPAEFETHLLFVTFIFSTSNLVQKEW